MDKSLDNYYRGSIRADGTYSPVGACKPCFQVRAKAAKSTNPAKAKAQAHASYLKRKDKYKESNAAYHAANRDAHNQQMRDRYQANKGSEKARVRKWNDDNPDKKYAAGVRRAASLSRATPAGEDMDRIRKVYQMARAWSTRLGIKMQVDHIVPLCRNGSHTWENLQVVSADINHGKGRNLYPNGFNYINLMTS